MVLLILFFCVSIVFSFLCSIWEAVLLSIPPSHVQIQLQEGGEVGKKLKSFKENIDKPLAAILTLNTIAHTVGAIGVGAQATKVYGASIMATAVVPVVMTLAILLLSEIIPKTLGANSWKSLTGFTVKSLSIIIWLLWPLVAISQVITKWLKKDKKRSVLSRADIGAMAEIGEKEGLFQDGESVIIQNLLRFKDIKAQDIMTPRTVVIAAKEDTTIKGFYDQNKTLRFSRIPIYNESKDSISAYVLKDQIYQYLIDNKDGDTKKLADIKREIMIVNEQLPIPRLFNRLMEKREHIALVVDEFGGMAGIATMEDVIETLLGLEIIDESDNIEDMQALARKNWQKRAKALGLLEESPVASVDLKKK